LSLLQIQTELNGWQGPLFPAGVEELGQVLLRSKNWLSAYYITAHFGPKIAGFNPNNKDSCLPVTNDGYQWHYGMEFSRGLGCSVLVAIPRWYEAGNKVEPYLERSPAVYVQRANEADASLIVHEMIRVLTTNKR
jgi:hypothetical protein